MKNVIALTATAHPTRFKSLFATVSNVLANTRNLTYTVLFNYGKQRLNLKDFKILEDLAQVNNNNLNRMHYPESMSVSQMYMDYLENCDLGNIEWWWNIDDDLIFPNESIRLIEDSIRSGVSDFYIYGCFDINNNRKHPDWDDKERDYSQIKELEDKFDADVLPFHKWKVNSKTPILVKLPHCFVGLIAIKIKELFQCKELVDILKGYQKGVRGWDNELSEYFEPYWIFGATSYHIGCNDPQIDGQTWTSINM